MFYRLCGAPGEMWKRGVRRHLHPSVKCPSMNIRLLWSCLINCNYFKSILQDLLIQPLLFPLLLLLLLLLFPKATTCNYPIAIINKISIWYHNIYDLFNFIFIIITISNNVVNTVIIIILDGSWNIFQNFWLATK